jgi:hypothetical protein
MSTVALIVIVVAVVVVLAALGAVVGRMRRRRRLRARFGPEYERTLRKSGNAQQAEADLHRRAAERDRLSIRQLTAAQRDRYEQDWRLVQAEFVDLPGTSLARADALVTAAMVDSGYPVRDFGQSADLISVDHPEVVERYRRAHGVFVASRASEVPTEDIRRAFVDYRALFAELVDPDQTPHAQPENRRSADQSSAASQ